MSKYLTIGAFAKLCQTTRDTLLHYDREGLLKPKYVSENGYRRYDIEQLFAFDMIATLKDTGSSIKEIREILNSVRGEDFLPVLRANLQRAKEEIIRLEERKQDLEDMIRLTEEAVKQTYDTFALVDMPEERMEVLPVVSASKQPSSSDDVYRLAESFDFYKKQNREPRYPLGSIVNQEDVAQGRFMERFFFSRATKATPPEQLHVKPAGLYAVMAHQGDYESHQKMYQGLLKYISGGGLSVCGNLYSYDLMSYLMLGASEDYAIKYCIAVQRP